MVKVPEDIAPEEELGRGVFSSKNANRAKRSRVPHHVFLTRPGEINISVNRLSVAPPNEALRIADRVAGRRDATFYGWAFVNAERAGINARQVVSSPLPGSNPYHADIVLPKLVAEDREEQKRHAQELADASRWRERPKSHEE